MAAYPWEITLKFTCGLIACTLGSSLSPTLGEEYGITVQVPFYLFCVIQVSEGVEYAQKVVDMPDRHLLTGRAYLMLGVGYSLMSDQVRLQTQRQSYQKKAVDAFLK